MLPASGQGILAIETLNVFASHGVAKQSIDSILARVNHAETYAIAVAEMAFLKALNAGCQFPVASFAEFVDVDTLKVRGIYWDEKKKNLLRAEVLRNVDLSDKALIESARQIGFELAEKISRQLI
jgi:hydroxymethylbilane synthase